MHINSLFTYLQIRMLQSLRNKSFYPWLVVGLLWVVALLNYMDRQMLSTMKEAMAIDITELQSAERFGVLMAIFLWIYGCVSPFAGAISDRVNRKWLIVGSIFVWSLVTFLMGVAEDFNQLRILRALMGISEALYIPAGLSLIADYHEGRSRSLAVGIHMTGLYMGQAIGGFGATLASAFSWHTTFFVFGLVGMVYALVLILFLYEVSKKRTVVKSDTSQRFTLKSFLQGFGWLFSNIAFWAILICFAVPSLPGWATKNWLPTLFSESLDIGMSKAGPLSTITIAASSFVGVLIGGMLSDRWVKCNLRGRIYTGAIGLTLTVPSLILLGYGHSVVAVVSAGILFGIGYGMFDANNMPILCQFVPARLRATAYGFMNMIGVFAGALVTQVLGKLKDEGSLDSGFIFLGLIVLIALAIQLLVLRPTTDNME